MINRSNLIKFQIFSALFAIILGIILHFTYSLSGNNSIIGLISAINESTWEHLKLLFFPMLITTIIGYLYIGKSISNFLCAKTIGIVSSILFTIVFFYTYTGILGTNYAVLNILTFIFSVILGEYITYKIIVSYFSCDNNLAIISLILLSLCFIIFTYYTPKLGLFKDPISWEFGLLNNI